MFGHYKRKRQKNERDALQGEVNRLKADQNIDPVQEARGYQSQVNQLADDQKKRDQIARQEGRLESDDYLNREYKGLGTQQRNNLQETANAQIARDIQGYDKRLLGQQGKRGVMGGAAYAQRADLARIGTEAQQQVQRDISSLDAEAAKQKLAQAYNIETGAVGQEAFRQQGAKDLLENNEQKKYQKWLTEQANKLFQRV